LRRARLHLWRIAWLRVPTVDLWCVARLFLARVWRLRLRRLHALHRNHRTGYRNARLTPVGSQPSFVDDDPTVLVSWTFEAWCNTLI
jgi:hypothetical protein